MWLPVVAVVALVAVVVFFLVNAFGVCCWLSFVGCRPIIVGCCRCNLRCCWHNHGYCVIRCCLLSLVVACDCVWVVTCCCLLVVVLLLWLVLALSVLSLLLVFCSLLFVDVFVCWLSVAGCRPIIVGCWCCSWRCCWHIHGYC